MEDNPYPHLKISDFSCLENVDNRSLCPRCKKSRKYYCYTCFCPVQDLQDFVPKVKLPVKIDIVKHRSEIDGKSTSAHAATLAPEYVTVYTYPCIPDFPDKSRVVLVFPGEDSVTLEQLAKECNILKTVQSTAKTNTQEMFSGDDKKHDDQNTKNKVDIVADEVKGQERSEVKGQKCQKSTLENDHVVRESSRDETGEPIAKQKRVEQNEGVHDKGQQWPERGQQKEEGFQALAQQSQSEQSHLTQSDTADYNNKGRTIYECPFDRVVFIDCTWNQTKSIIHDERLRGLRCIVLNSHKTKFWRHQHNKPDTYLATVEAIYYFLREYHDLFVDVDYRGEYDDILFFFAFMYQKIKTLFDGGKELRAYKKQTDKE